MRAVVADSGLIPKSLASGSVAVASHLTGEGRGRLQHAAYRGSRKREQRQNETGPGPLGPLQVSPRLPPLDALGP